MKFLGQINFSSSLTKKLIRDNDKQLTNINGKKVNAGHVGLMTGLGAIVGHQTGMLSTQYKQYKANLPQTGKGLKAKVLGTALGAGLSGGLSYYLQTRDRNGRSDKGKKRK